METALVIGAIMLAVIVVAVLLFYFLIIRRETKRQENFNEKTKTEVFEQWRKFKVELGGEVYNFKRSMRQYIHDKVGSDRQIRKLERKMNESEKKDRRK